MHLPAMLADDAVDGVEAEPRPFSHPLSRKEGLEQVSLDFGRNTVTVVDDVHLHAVPRPRGPNSQFTLAVHGVRRVIDQVRPNLVKFAAGCANSRQRAVVLASHLNAMLQAVMQN